MTARRSNISLKRKTRSRGGGVHLVMPFRRPFCLGAALIASAIAGCMAISNGLAPNPVTVATGTPGGVIIWKCDLPHVYLGGRATGHALHRAEF